jgi:hypothetical protein
MTADIVVNAKATNQRQFDTCTLGQSVMAGCNRLEIEATLTCDLYF